MATCFLCKENTIGVLFYSCHHYITCFRCTNFTTRCLECKGNVSAQINVPEREECCVVCKKNAVDVLFLPCFHVKTCQAFAAVGLLYSTSVFAEESKASDRFHLQTLNTFLRAKSCLDLLRDGVTQSGFYQIFDEKDYGHTVYCDITSEPGSAWTLVMSHAMERRFMMQFRISLMTNNPVNGKTANWHAYRMTLDMMKSVAIRSTHWRYTCDFPQYGVDYHDYARARFSFLNPLTFDEDGECVMMEYVNIRGNACAECKAQWWQTQSTKRILHMDSYKNHCALKSRQGAIQWEDNFGFYDKANPKFRCTATQSASTNLWFGGYL